MRKSGINLNEVCFFRFNQETTGFIYPCLSLFSAINFTNYKVFVAAVKSLVVAVGYCYCLWLALSHVKCQFFGESQLQKTILHYLQLQQVDPRDSAYDNLSCTLIP